MRLLFICISITCCFAASSHGQEAATCTEALDEYSKLRDQAMNRFNLRNKKMDKFVSRFTGKTKVEMLSTGYCTQMEDVLISAKATTDAFYELKQSMDYAYVLCSDPDTTNKAIDTLTSDANDAYYGSLSVYEQLKSSYDDVCEGDL